MGRQQRCLKWRGEKCQGHDVDLLRKRKSSKDPVRLFHRVRGTILQCTWKGRGPGKAEITEKGRREMLNR